MEIGNVNMRHRMIGRIEGKLKVGKGCRSEAK